MKKLLLFCTSILPILSFSQELLIQKKRCATYEVLENYRKQHPGTETDLQFETWLIKKKAAGPMTALSTVTLPVVFHIIHNGEAEGTGTNIPQSAIIQQVLQLNKDFANLSNSPYAVAANTNIQFALAQTNPSGMVLAQPGIDRVDRNAAGFTAPPYTVGYSGASNYLTNTIKPNTIWDPSRYINIWVLPMESGILGIATFPASSGLSGISSSETDQTAGVAVIPASIGSSFAPNGCTGYSKGKTLTHELGHFFGLRHIWGDGICGNDYCDDTPVHADANSGIPSHPKANGCGTADEMFENYMDYSNDAVLNTFTLDQASRMQTVLINSPRRNTLASSNVGLVAASASNRIAFADCSGSFVTSERGTTGTGPRYHELTFMLTVDDKATGDATVAINASGTAINNFDYQVMTPVVTFVNGDNFKTVTVRILDNAQVDGNRTLILNYSISGTGVAAGSSAQSMAITITDDDNVIVSQNQLTLLSQNFDVSLTGWGSLYSSGMSNLFQVSNGGNAGGSGNCAYISNSTSAPYANSYTKNTAGAAVLRSPLIDASGVSNLQLTFKYRVWGEADFNYAYDYGMVTYATQSSPTSFFTTGAAGAGPYAGVSAGVSGSPTVSLPDNTFANNKFYLGFYWENDNNTGDDVPFAVDDIVLTGAGTNVEPTVSSSYSYDIQAGSAVNNIRSINNRMIASLTNSSSALSGIVASVTQAGTGQQVVTTSAGSYMRTQKVIQISPSSPNSTVTYQATLFFTAEELSVWGANKLNLKILKIKDGVSLSDPINSSNATLVTPVSVNEDAAGGYITYTANFTGFSQFVLVAPTFTLPVNFLSFDAKPGKTSIELKWQTAMENNNKGFVVERSTDMSRFSQIGWIEGQGTTSFVTGYSYSDKYVQPNTTYYYRLKQVDFNGRQAVSSIRQAMITHAELTVLTFPNPATDHVKIFLTGATGLANISLFNTKGQNVLSRSGIDLSILPYTLSIGHLASGHYTLTIHLKGQDVSTKLVVQ